MNGCDRVKNRQRRVVGRPDRTDRRPFAVGPDSHGKRRKLINSAKLADHPEIAPTKSLPHLVQFLSIFQLYFIDPNLAELLRGEGLGCPTNWRSPAARLLRRPLQRLVSRYLRVHSDRGTESWPARRGSMKQTLHAEVLVNVRPMNSLAGSDEAKVCSLRRRGLGQPPGPR